jgi:FkbM family methyltransferase
MNYFISDKFYIFGAGKTGKIFKSILEKNHKKVISFITSQNSSTEVEGIPVINLAENSKELNNQIPVIIAVFNREENAHMNFITEYLKKLKFQNIVHLYDFIDEYSTQIDNLYWLTNRDYYHENLSKFLKVKELFKEQQSIDIYDNIINFLLTFNLNILPTPNPTNQYFPDNIKVWDGMNAFLDVGSFDGQTIMDAYSRYGKLGTVIAYEPDPLNIKFIKQKIDLFNPAVNFFLIPCGVGSSVEILKFSSGFGEGSAIQKDGDCNIQCLSLDDTLFGIVPGYIKMDIEGAEFEALRGAENTIKKYRPSLAISLYHKPDHLFEVPLLIKSWNLGYNYYIRSHGNNLFETVLYCIPNTENK